MGRLLEEVGAWAGEGFMAVGSNECGTVGPEQVFAEAPKLHQGVRPEKGHLTGPTAATLNL